MGFFNWGNSKEKPAVRSPAPKPEKKRVGEDTIPYRPFAPKIAETAKPGSEDTQPIMVEPMPESGDVVEAELLPDEVAELPAPVRQMVENANRAPDRAAEEAELRKLTEALNKDHPGGLYFVKEWDEDGNILDMTLKPWKVDKIYPVRRSRPDGTGDVIHRVRLREIGTDNTDGYLLGEFFSKRLLPEDRRVK